LHKVLAATAQPGARCDATNPRTCRPAGPWGRVSTIRLETFSDACSLAIAVTLLALQLNPPNLDGATTTGAVLHGLGRQLRQFGFYALAFLVTGRLWSEHHLLLDPPETHGRGLPRANLWFLLGVSLLPYWVNVLATYPNNTARPGCSCCGWRWCRSRSCSCAERFD
jgi:Endosomal/lysosomal potassium channel TMEM175